MPDMAGGEGDTAVDRRTLLAGLGAATTAGLAGCGGGGQNTPAGGTPGGQDGDTPSGDTTEEGGELGERVPTMVMEYPANVPSFELIQPIMADGIQKSIGVKTKVNPVEIATAYGNIITDQRTSPLPMYYQVDTPNRLDPHQTLIQFSIENAGATPAPNLPQYTDCEYSTLAHEQTQETDTEKRREMVHEAFAMMNEDICFLPSGSATLLQVVRKDKVDVGGYGKRYLANSNPVGLSKSESKTDDNTIIIATDVEDIQTSNYPTFNQFDEMAIWNHLVHSPLVEYDENLEKFNALADSIEYERDGKRVIAELKDATFHNGDPVTAEDVKFTFEQITEHKGTYPNSPTVPFDSISVVDEKTTQFDLTETYVPFVSKDIPLWGIMHKQTWVEGGARENPADFEFDPPIGSGPFKVKSHQEGQTLELEPHGGHPVLEPNSNILFQSFQNAQTEFQAVKAGEIHVAFANPKFANQAENIESLRILSMNTTTNLVDPFQMNIAPTKFKPFRRACGLSVNHPKILKLYSPKYGKTNPWGLTINELHPWHPPTDMLQEIVPQDGPKPEKAKQVLADAGWGWDDNGRLHYPPDADLSPQWPKGETPDPANFACLDQDGNYVPPGER